MTSPFYPRTKSKKQTNTVMIEKETSIISTPRKPRRKSRIETSIRDQEVQIVETCSTKKQVEDIIERLEKEALEKTLILMMWQQYHL